MTTTKVESCGKCGGNDFTPKGACRGCKRAKNVAYRERAAGKTAAKTKAKNAKPAAEISALLPEGTTKLEIQQGFGLKAWTDEPYLFLEQSDGEGKTDALCLSRSELRQLIDKFGPWAAA